MTEKRFTDDGIEEIENQSFTDNLTEKTYWIDNGLDEIVELLNNFNDENKQLKSDALYWSQNAEARLKEIDKLRKEKEQLQDTLAFRSNQLALMEELIDDLGTDEMCREMEDILNG